jgi:two-component system CheB/CheR fusion protein
VNGEFVFDWVERDVVLTSPMQSDGFGRRYIEQGLPFQLGAKTSLEFKPDGVHCRIVMPLNETPAGVAP